MNIRRADIVLVNLNPTKGSEQRGRRPAVIIQNDVGNRYAPTTILAPMTTSYDPNDIAPYEVELRAGEEDVDRDSVVLLNQIRTVDMSERIVHKFGEVSREKMEEIDQSIKISLGLE
ncbi:type II toxin-antitoxin system PemK/MazF family toxin [Haloterrigena alkaliphila]|uniref:Type II toxin-antitoxin system PemK/MazF family toxin n=1 Tax=Haloterrigena alkaliphila TaxID=2816475 RepID=A0A8A2V9D2_9EURY|nr:type II toxin-antitoxin system PemK/MazF family toxin [Haloterrigena alkaliphila]QSW97646.1 type II toxin-antitoxin system PemK/MazF family toxin [Haloterrigena alkaliphila]